MSFRVWVDLGEQDSLSTRATVTPNVPGAFETLLCADTTDLWAGDAFVVAIIPLPNVLGDLNMGIAGETIIRAVTVRLPRKST